VRKVLFGAARPTSAATVITGELTPQELVGMEIALPSANSVAVRASVRYWKEPRCGCEFVDLHDPEREAIQAASERFSRRAGLTYSKSGGRWSLLREAVDQAQIRLESDVQFPISIQADG
jgi:hypothetical protein